MRIEILIEEFIAKHKLEQDNTYILTAKDFNGTYCVKLPFRYMDNYIKTRYFVELLRLLRDDTLKIKVKKVVIK